jgi:hypothetical protein
MKFWVLLALTFLILIETTPAYGQDSLQVGYAVVTHESPTTQGLDVFATFGQMRSGETTQAGVLSSQMTTKAMFFVGVSRTTSRDLGVAVANPGGTTANLTLTLRNDSGALVATRTLTVNARQHTSQFVSQLFPAQTELTGTLTVDSSTPVAIVILRFRGSNFSTLSVINLSTASAVPEIMPGVGGPGAFILPQFAAGAGWASEIVIVNSSTGSHDMRIDLFKTDGTPMVVTMNGQSKSSFEVQVHSGGTAVLSTQNVF